MKNYVNNLNSDILAAELMPTDSEFYIFTASNPDLPVGTILTEENNPDSPRYRITAASSQASGGPWFAPVELVMQDYNVTYSFLTFTHSTIAGAMIQNASTKAEAASLIRDWLTKIYRPVEIDHVTAEPVGK